MQVPRQKNRRRRRAKASQRYCFTAGRHRYAFPSANARVHFDILFSVDFVHTVRPYTLERVTRRDSISWSSLETIAPDGCFSRSKRVFACSNDDGRARPSLENRI